MSPPAQKKSVWIMVGQYTTLAMLLPAATAVGYLIGYTLDRAFHTSFLRVIFLLLGIAAGSGKGVIFKRGVPIRNVVEADMVAALLEEVERFDEDTPPLEGYAEKQKKKGNKPGLTVLQ